jgi:hypothetical protein
MDISIKLHKINIGKAKEGYFCCWKNEQGETEKGIDIQPLLGSLALFLSSPNN